MTSRSTAFNVQSECTKQLYNRLDKKPYNTGEFKVEVITPKQEVFIYSNESENELFATDVYELARMIYPESLTVLVDSTNGKRRLIAVGSGTYIGYLYAEKDAAALFMATEDDDQLTKQICTGIYPTQSK